MAKKPVAVEDLSEEQAAAELARLAREIAEHDKRYYQHDAPTISDADYDALRRRAEAIERAFPIWSGPNRRRSASARRRRRNSARSSTRCRCCRSAMPSPRKMCANSSAASGASCSLRADETVEITAEPKIDGLSISLRYEEGRLMQAATRGDGFEGENVTANARTVDDIPNGLRGKSVPAVIEVRGEIYMTHKDFARAQ